jgi:hypothetical protein
VGTRLANRTHAARIVLWARRREPWFSKYVRGVCCGSLWFRSNDERRQRPETIRKTRTRDIDPASLLTVTGCIVPLKSARMTTATQSRARDGLSLGVGRTRRLTDSLAPYVEFATVKLRTSQQVRVHSVDLRIIRRFTHWLFRTVHRRSGPNSKMGYVRVGDQPLGTPRSCLFSARGVTRTCFHQLTAI